MDENLFDFINIEKGNIHFPYHQGMNELDISNYDSLISSMGGLDLTILGVGTDGHIAFNEPGSELNSITRLVKLSYQTRKDNSRFFNDDIKNVPEFAVTMGLETILKSKRILLLVSGESKKEALMHLLEAKEFDPN
ncbi:6-phosphogluconolactonase [bacterium]|nr:6-phosphogluconolactonase [bacterium]